MKRLLITGGAGFLGHHCVEGVLKNTDWDVVVMDRLDVSGNLNKIADIEVFEQMRHRVYFVWHDLKAAISAVTDKLLGDIDYVWHLAASARVDESIADPALAVLDNVLGTTNLLLWARQRAKEGRPVKLFINFSTDEVYGPVAGPDIKSKITDPHHPKNQYAATKSGQEKMGEAFANTDKMPIITTHAMNIFGERQDTRNFIPKVTRMVLLGETVPIHATPDKKAAGGRWYIHARSVADALLFLTNRPFDAYAEYNIVGEKPIDNLTLAKMIAGIVGKELKYELVDWHSSRPGHDLWYGMEDNLTPLGWRLPKSFEESLEKTVLWTLKRPHYLLL